MAQVTDALGRPGEGIHAHRTLGLATSDVVATIVAAALIAAGITWGTFATRFALALVTLILLGIVLHAAFRVPTALNRWLGKLAET